MKKCIVLCLVVCLPLCGCWNRREIGNLAIVMGFAVDTAQEDGKIEITSQIANTRKGPGSTEAGGTDTQDYKNVTISGDYVFPSIRESVMKTGSKLYMSHNLVVLFGEDIAYDGVGNYLDMFLRDHELRLGMYMMVAKGRGADVLAVDKSFEKIPAMHIDKLLKAQDQTSTGITTSVIRFMEDVVSGRVSPLVPIIEIDDSGDEPELKINGTAVFEKDKMLGTLSNTETRGYLWATGDLRHAVLVVSADDANVGIDVLHEEGHMRASYDADGKGHIEIAVKAQANIGSERGGANFANEAGAARLEEALAAEIEKEIQQCIDKSHTLRGDVLGFEELLYKQNPRKAADLSKEELQNPTVKITVETTLLTTGRIGGPVQ